MAKAKNVKSKSSPLISAVICTYDRYDELPGAIESLLTQDLAADQYEILVIDNLPTHENFSRFQRRYHGKNGVRYIAEPIAGLSQARNTALAQCHGQYIAFIDDDARACPVWLSNILKTFRTFGPACAVVGGPVRPIWLGTRPNWLADNMLGALSLVDWGGEHAHVAAAHEWFAGTNITFDVKILRRYGGFSTDLGRSGLGSSLLGNEEIACMRHIRSEGYLNVYAPAALVEHRLPTDRLKPEWFRKRMAWQAVSDLHLEGAPSLERLEQAWHNLTGFMAQLPPENRSLRGLFIQPDSAEQAERQVGMFYDLCLMTLSAFSRED